MKVNINELKDKIKIDVQFRHCDNCLVSNARILPSSIQFLLVNKNYKTKINSI